MGYLSQDHIMESVRLSHGPKIVLLVIAKHVNDQTKHLECWPSISRLSELSGMSERNTQRILKDLAEQKYISVLEKGNGKRSTRYRLNIDYRESITEPSGVTGCHPSPIKISKSRGDNLSSRGDIVSEGVTRCHARGDMVTPESRIESIKESHNEVVSLPHKIKPETIPPRTEPPVTWNELKKAL
ncbi:MAG: helix-turn-helix domain-containing protein [Neptuniibacter sp.]